MAVYFRYKSAKEYDSIPILDQFISVANLKLKIFESKRYGRGKDFDLLVTNPQTNDDYNDQYALIPRNTSVLITRVPGIRLLPIVIPSLPQVIEEEEEAHTVKAAECAQDLDLDDFGDDVYTIQAVVPIQSSNRVEEKKIEALIDMHALGWQQLQSSDGNGDGRRIMGGMEWKQPPPGYVCHRCKVPGHFIQHCPTNGDPNFDIKTVVMMKPPTGVSKSMVMSSSDGSCVSQSGGVSKGVSAGLHSMRSVRSRIPRELHCSLCKEVMKEAVLTGKCCFRSFCCECIRNHITYKSMCVCGARNVLVGDLLPNMTVRKTINRLLESDSSSAESGISDLQVQDMVLAHHPLSKTPPSLESAASKVPGEVLLAPCPRKGDLKRKRETSYGVI